MKKTIIAFLICLSTFTLKAGIQVTTIADSTVKSPYPIEGKNSFEIDLNNDGVVDITIAASFFLGDDGPHPYYDCHVVKVDSTGSNMVNCGPFFFQSDTIGNNLSYEYSQWIFGGIPGIGGVGLWDLKVGNIETYAYIGVKFYIGSNIHFGWVELKTDAYTFSISRYAYNDTQNQQIIAGQI